MRSRYHHLPKIRFFLFTLSLCLFLTEADDLSALQERLRFISGETSYELGARPLREGSVSVRVGDSDLSVGEDYEVNHFTGTVRFLRSFSPGTIFLVTFEMAGSPFLSYSLAEVLPVLPADSLPAYDDTANFREVRTNRGKKEKSRGLFDLPSSNLKIAGEKVLSMEVSADRGAVLSQSLDLSVGGNITEGTDLRVYLSDSAMPVEADGSSKEVRELDKVSVSVTGRNAAATVGAYSFELDGYELTQVKKNLEGFSSNIRGNGFTIGGAGAVSGGEFTVDSFQGVEGKQGPYFLKDSSGRSGIVIIAGSEKVYLDGRLLERGARGDYIVNYNEGNITFTDRNMITSYSRLDVEFEYANSTYRKSFVATDGSINLGDRSLVRGFIMREHDMEGSPVSGEFSENELAQLASYEGEGEILLSGGRYVGEGEGDYRLRDAESDEEEDHFEYVGAGKGDYQVTFTRVQQGEGDYGLDPGTTQFVYFGEGQGDYLAARKVRPPTSRVTSGAAFRYEEEGRFSLGGEGFLSAIDHNTFSSGASRQEAMAFDLGGSLEDRELSVGNRGLGTYSLGLKQRYLGNGFEVSGRLYEADFSRHWGVSTGYEGSGESTSEASIGYSLADLFDVSTQLGFLERGNGEGSRRREIRAGLSPFAGTKVGLVRESAVFTAMTPNSLLADGRVSRTKTSAEKKFGRWLTSFQSENETRIEPTGSGAADEGKKRDTMRATMRGDIGKSIGLSVSAMRESGEQRTAGAWRDWMKAGEGDLELNYRPGTSSSFNTHLAHRLTRFTGTENGVFGTTIGRLEYYNFPASGNHRTHVSYELTNTSRVKNKVTFLPERSESEGEYLEDGTYVGREEGTHRKEVLSESDVGERIVKVSLSGVQTTDLSMFLPVSNSLSSLNLTSTFHLVEENNALADRGLYTFTSADRFSEDHSVYSENNLREELEARWNEKGLSLKIEYILNHVLDNRYENLMSGNRLESATLFVKSRSRRGLELSAEAGRGNEARERTGAFDQVRFIHLGGEVAYQVGETLRMSVKFKGEDRELGGGYGARLYEFSPGITRFFRSRGRLNVDLDLVKADGRVENYLTSLWLLKGKEFGLNSRLGIEGEYRIGSSLLFIGRLSLRKTAGQRYVRSGGNTELRYLF